MRKIGDIVTAGHGCGNDPGAYRGRIQGRFAGYYWMNVFNSHWGYTHPFYFREQDILPDDAPVGASCKKVTITGQLYIAR